MAYELELLDVGYEDVGQRVRRIRERMQPDTA